MAKHSAIKARPPQQPSRAQRQESESGTDHDHDHDHDDTNDHDQEDNENDNDNDNDNEQEDNDTQQQQADGSTPIKRKRLTQACDPCRKKKIKCDGLKPSCANCAKLEVQCTYLPSLKKRGPRQGYIELLEKRLDKMEKMLQHGPGAIDPDLLDPPSGHRPGADATNNDGIHSDNRTGDHRYFGNTSAISRYQDLQITPPASITQSGTTAGAQIRSKRPIYGIRDEIPRKDILDHLITLFFDSVYYQFPIIHPDTFMKQYREGKVSPNLLNGICAGVARFSNHPDVVTTPAFLAGEPFATNVRSAVIDSIDIPTVSNVQALLFLSMYEYGAARGPRAWMYGGMAIRMALELGLNREDSSPVFYLKGDWVMRETRRRAFWACFIMDVLASSSSGRPRMMDERDCEVLLPSEDNAWHEARPVVTEMLQEDEKPTSATPDSPSCKPAAMDLGKDDLPGEDLSDNERRDSITDGDPSQKVPSLSSFAYLIRILAVLGKVSQYVNRPRAKRSIPPNEPGSEFSVINAALDAWLSSVPPHHSYSVENASRVKDKGEGCMIVFMHVIYHTSVVLLHRPILAADKASFPIDSNFVETSVARCAEAASKVSEVLDFVSNQSCPPRVFISSFFAYPVFTTATIHITNAFASDPVIAARARRNLSTHVKILQTMKSYWAMADKFFYIIRDLYSIQSKISSSAANGTIVVPQVVSHNAHGLHDYASDSAVTALKAKEKIMDADRQGRVGVDRTEAEAAHGGVMEGHASAPKMVVSSKLASISSFLKSDSGLIALWRRATEMQVIDEANQEKRRLSQTTEESRKIHQISIQDEKEQGMEEKELMEQRIRMNQLEIQEINQEFERQWKAKLLAEQQQKQQQQQQSTTSSDNTSISVESQADGQDQTKSGEVSPTEKRPTEADELANPRAVKQARVSKPEATFTPPRASQRKPRSNSNSSSNSTTPSTTSPITTPWPSMDLKQAQSGPQPGSHVLSAADGNLMYRQPIAQPPQSIPGQGNFIMAQQQQQQQQQQPVMSAPNASMMTAAGRPADVSQHLLNVYAQQHQQQEAISQSIDVRQNATIQRQQQQLQQQQAQAQMTSSLSLGPPGGFTSGYAPPPTMAPQQPTPMSQFRQHQQQHHHYQHQQQPQPQQQTSAAGFSSPGFYPPLIYGSSYSHQTATHLQKEPMDSIFDFAMPLGDLNFLSSSFQMTPMMMQQTPAAPATSGGNAFMQQPTTMNNLPPGSMASQSRMQQQPQQQQQAMSVSSSSTATTSSGSPSLQVPGLNANNGSDGRGGRLPADSKSPPTTTQISPGLDSFMMSDEAFAEMQSTPDSLIRYLQHHHQQQQQQDLQLQPKDNRQPLLTQQNSLLYDDYFQWGQPPSVAPSPQPPHQHQHQHQQHAQQVQQVQVQQQQQIQILSPMSMDMDTPVISGRVVAHSSIPSFS